MTTKRKNNQKHIKGDGMKKSRLKKIIIITSAVILSLILLLALICGVMLYSAYREFFFCQLDSIPSRADVYVEGKKIGQTPLRVEKGILGNANRITIKKSGYADKMALLYFSDFRLTVTLFRQFTVITEPEGAMVWVDRILHGKTPIDILTNTDGTLIEVRMEGYYSRSIIIAPDTPQHHIMKLRKLENQEDSSTK